jgi:mRNA interferase MazF
VKRGEIWTASGGPDYAGKPRPVLILQDDAFEDTASVTICLLTTHEVAAPLLRIGVAPNEENGLREPSWIMADKISTVSRARLGDRIGALSAAEMLQVSRAASVFLGLAGAAP